MSSKPEDNWQYNIGSSRLNTKVSSKGVKNNLFHDEHDTHNSDDFSNCSQNSSKSEYWNTDENEDVYTDEMNIDIEEYNIDETGLDKDHVRSGSEESDSNGN